MMRSVFITCTVVAALTLPVSAFGQFNNSGGGGRSGSSGSSGFGGSSGSSGFGSSGFGNAGSSGFGSNGGFGSSGFGQSGSGGMGMGSGSGMGGLGQGGLGGQQQGFLGVNNNPNQFLGRTNTGQQQGGMGQNGMMNQFGNNRGGNRGNNLNTMNSMFGSNGMNSGMNRPQQVIRPRQKVAFDYPAPQVDTLHVNLRSQLDRVALRNPGMTNVMVSIEPSGELVLRGAVKSEADAKLAANLVRLEPGVRSVRNELTFPPADGGTME